MSLKQLRNHTNSVNEFPLDGNSGSSSAGNVVMSAAGLLLATYVIMANITTITTLYRTPKLHTLSNKIISSLAVIDLLVGFVLIPFSLSFIDSFHSVLDRNIRLCQLLLGSCLGSTVGSSLHILLIAFERYIYIVWPFHYRRLVTRLTLKCGLSGVWMLGLMFFTMPLVVGRLDVDKCSIRNVLAGYIVYSICPVFGVYATLNVALYSRILKTAWNQRRALDIPRGSFVDDTSTTSQCSDSFKLENYRFSNEGSYDNSKVNEDFSRDTRPSSVRQFGLHESSLPENYTHCTFWDNPIFEIDHQLELSNTLKAIPTMTSKNCSLYFKTGATEIKHKLALCRPKTNNINLQQHPIVRHDATSMCTTGSDICHKHNQATTASLSRTQKYKLTSNDKANFYFNLTQCNKNLFAHPTVCAPNMSNSTSACSLFHSVSNVTETTTFPTETTISTFPMTTDSTSTTSTTTTTALRDLNSPRKSRSQKRLAVVVALFFIHLVCKTPVVVTMVVNLLTNETHDAFLPRMFSLLALSNSGVNFVVFFLLQQPFRKAVKRQLLGLLNSFKSHGLPRSVS